MKHNYVGLFLPLSNNWHCSRVMYTLRISPLWMFSSTLSHGIPLNSGNWAVCCLTVHYVLTAHRQRGIEPGAAAAVTQVAC